MRKKDPKFIAQLYLLSASELLWLRAKQVMCSPGFIDYSCLDLKLTEPNDYLYFCTAMDIQYVPSAAEGEPRRTMKQFNTESTG